VRTAFPGIALSLAACATAGPSDWSPPRVATVSCEDWATVTENSRVYVNNVWNAHAAGDFGRTQCIVRDPADPDRLGFYWRWPISGSSIYAQPQVKIGLSPWSPHPRLDDSFPVAMERLTAMNVTADVSVDGPSEFNVVTTLWLTDTGKIGTDPQPESIRAEIMFWTYATAGHMSPAGRKVATVSSDGANWDVWVQENWHDASGLNDNRWLYVAFVAQQPSLSVTFDPVDLLRSAPLAELGLDTAFIADVEHGSEVMQGEGLLWIDRFEVSLEPR
jgi:hypothetical protein